MGSGLVEYIKKLREPVAESSLEPELDDIDPKLDKQLREQVDLNGGAVRKKVLQEGQGKDSPADGDLVFFHLSVKKEDGTILETTRPDEDGTAVPKVFILGKGRRAPRGWELALQGMLRGERAVFMISPEYSFAEKGCSVMPPAGIAADASLLIDVQLLNWYAKSDGVKPVGDSGIIKRTTKDSASWEHPHAPFEVEVLVKARVPSSNGMQGEGAPFFGAAQPLCWTIGSGAVGSHLEEGICSMSKGEKAFLSCPCDATSPLVPGSAQAHDRIEYEVELLGMVQVRDLTGTGDVTKRRLKEGVGEFPIDCPLEDNAVRVHFKGYLPNSDEVFFDSRGANGRCPPLEFDTGVDAVPEAVDMCVRLMTPQEVALVRSSPKFAYQGRGDRPEGCPQDATVYFEIELIDFEKTPHWHSMTAGDKLVRAEQIRRQGNTTFQLGQLKFARHKYLKALKLLDNAYDADEAQAVEVSAAKANCFANLALISQKESNFTECFSWCEKTLAENPEHAKGLYRRGTTHAILGDFKEAEDDLLRAQAADPSTAAGIERELTRLKAKQKAAILKERKDFKNFFDRTAK